MSGADTLKAEGLMLESMLMSYVRMGCKAKGCIISIGTIGTKGGKIVYSVRLLLDLAVKHALMNISPEGQQWELIETMPTTNAPIVVGHTTRLPNAQSLSHKHSIMRCILRQVLSQYL